MARRMSPRLLPLLLVVAACGTPAPKGPTVAEVKEKLAACTYGPGALPKDTLPGDAKVGAAMPIDHFVLVMQENRSFDHYFSRLSHGGVHTAGPANTNPDSQGIPTPRYHEWRYCLRDVNHSWNGSHRQYNDGAMDGFVVTNEPEGRRAMAWYDEADLPYYYALARTFAISDMHFSSVMGPTQPNRLYYWAGTSFGATKNGLPPVDAESLFLRLDEAGVAWKSYVSDVASPAVFVNLVQTNHENFRDLDEFFQDAAAGTLPPVSVVEATFTGGVPKDQGDEHPESNIQHGQAFTAKVVNALLASPNWSKSALLFLYDEHGGFYDSVPPPKACEPDDKPPVDDPTRRFDHLGFRTPLIVVSPFVKRGYVSHVPVDHTAVTRLVETRFELPAMTKRDANAWPLLDLFDFDHPDTSVPALPEAVVDPERDARCKLDFPP